MKIDWGKQADPKAVQEAASVLRSDGERKGFERVTRRRGFDGPDTSLEGRAESAGAAGPSEKERIERLGEAISRAVIDPLLEDHETVRREVVAGARSGLAKTFQGAAPEAFTLGEQVGLEAVILTNGERPSLFVKGGFIDLAAPDIGEWDWALTRFEKDIRSVAGSVGRIDVPVKPGFAGTCFVLAEGLVITNRHVLEAIATRGDAGVWTLNWADSTTVDFVGEDGATTSTRFKVTGVAYAGPDAIDYRIDFAHLDLAVLRVDPVGETKFPDALTFEVDAAQPKAKRNLYALGFPGKPRQWVFEGVPDPGYETSEVLSAVFNGKFGVKKLAPGVVKTGPGGLAGDAKAWVFAHDASTLGGSSGSVIVDLTDSGLKVLGLHFGGSNREQNWAHVIAKLSAELDGAKAPGVA